MSNVPAISKTKMQLISSLKTTKIRKKEGLFCVEASKGVCDTIIHFPLEILAATAAWYDAHPSIACSFPGKCFSASPAEISRMTSLSTASDVIAVFRTPARKELPEGKLNDGLYLLLDGVQDPGNLGTIIRTAHWFGIRKIFASNTTADLYNPKTIQSTMGSIAAVEVGYCNIAELVRNNPQIPLCILDLEGEDIFTSDLPQSAFIAMGSEGKGLSPELKELANLRLTIPPGGENHPDSLNVAIATALTIAQFTNAHRR